MNEYDAGILNDWGGGNVDWWHDYLRYEIANANVHWAEQVESLRAELAACREALVDTKSALFAAEMRLAARKGEEGERDEHYDS